MASRTRKHIFHVHFYALLLCICTCFFFLKTMSRENVQSGFFTGQFRSTVRGKKRFYGSVTREIEFWGKVCQQGEDQIKSLFSYLFYLNKLCLLYINIQDSQSIMQSEHTVNIENSCIPKLGIFNAFYITSTLHGIIFDVCVTLVQALSTLVVFEIPILVISAG